MRDLPLPDVAGVSHRWVDVGGVSIHVAEAGAGDPLVLLHGWPQNWYCWRYVMPLLADRYRLVMPDLRGHGWSAAPAGGYDKEQLASDLLVLLDELELDTVGMVGHDWGGWTGFLAALRAPERFHGLLALGILHPFQRPTAGRALQAWRGAYQVLLSTPVVAEALLRSSPRFVGEGILMATARREAFSGDDLRLYGDVLRRRERARASVRLYRTFLLRELPRLGRYLGERLVVPTHLLIGDRDPLYSPALMAGWRDHADDMEVDVLTGVGHFLPEEAPGDVAEAATRLFRGG